MEYIRIFEYFFHKAINPIYFWGFASVEALQNISDEKSHVAFDGKKEKQRMALGLSEAISWRNIQYFVLKEEILKLLSTKNFVVWVPFKLSKNEQWLSGSWDALLYFKTYHTAVTV